MTTQLTDVDYRGETLHVFRQIHSTRDGKIAVYNVIVRGRELSNGGSKEEVVRIAKRELDKRSQRPKDDRCNKGHLLQKNERGIWDCPICKRDMERIRRGQ